MNKCMFIGRLTRDPEVKNSAGAEGSSAVAKYSIAVDRRYKKEGEPNADFIPCVAFNANAEFAEKYLHQGMKMVITGRFQTGSYTNKENIKMPSFNLIVEEQEFAESKTANQNIGNGIPEGSEDEGLPFN